ncbi:type III pantothenate kinase [Herbinix luporum]|jgi:type III pantothenate kinase|uniref:Type III pantothenate kinase n=1 Tax=Herbinix luporum TaxID=1679721 RepID=A0A0K8J7N4_9FIRM|nr:type III pantothenate kinase [Herbinix luporum]MDI9487810.1 type III pantothenate kinase [Bacillota bacterium]CUH93646.1 Type III pantothenate kinase [Herbinix luporum]HHT56913.1 type III pantothenate kinase [Herbinix luporum]
MIFVIDVGNTTMTMGVFDKDEIKAKFRLTTQINRTSDEYGLYLADLLTLKGISIDDIETVVISSVVPRVMYSLVSGIKKYIGITPLILGVGAKTGIKIPIPNPKEVGADRVADAVGAYEIYGGPVLVADFGTANKYDLITEDGSLIAAVTCPGLKMSANAMWSGTAKLPEVEIALPDTILAKDTVTSMQAGLVFGCIGQTEYIIKRMLKEAGLDKCTVVATGGLGRIIANNTDVIDIYDPNLLLKGLKFIADKNRVK